MKNMDRQSASGRLRSRRSVFFSCYRLHLPRRPTAYDGELLSALSAGNPVGNIQGGGQPWTALGGRARVDLGTSRVNFDVQGLVLAGGNTIGTPDAIVQVKGTLVCDAGVPNVTLDTALVPLSPEGDADFSGPIGPIPSTCNRIQCRVSDSDSSGPLDRKTEP